MGKPANYLDCNYCGKPMEHVDVVAVVMPAADGAGGAFKFAHRGECAKALREGRDYIQVQARIENGELVLEQ